MTVIEQAERRLQEEIRQNDLGADNGHLLAYWAAYLDGARAQRNELARFPSKRKEAEGGWRQMERFEHLIKALRCENTGDDECGSSDCPYWSGLGCMDGQLMEDAAAAIEALQAEHKKTVTQIFEEDQQEWEEYCTGLMNRIRELNAQLPKRGEWITTKYHTWECSVCRKNPTTGMGYVQTRKALYNYCPNCGAKMEVQDGQA